MPPVLTADALLDPVLLAPGDEARQLLIDRDILLSAAADCGILDLLLDYERRVLAALTDRSRPRPDGFPILLTPLLSAMLATTFLM